MQPLQFSGCISDNVPSIADVGRGLLQEQKYKRQQGLEGAEPWTVQDEKALSSTNAKMSQALIFCKVKH